VTEAELFAAYRTPTGYATECACGDIVEASDSDEATVTQALAVHQESTVHEQWRVWQEAVLALQRPVRHPCPCTGHDS
jgi:hypothetical protein